MWLLILEAMAALALLLGLVWWTMFSGRRRVEGARVVGHAEECAAHRALGCGDPGPARVLEVLAGLEYGLVADDGQTADLLRAARGIAHQPLAGDELRGGIPGIGDPHRVGEGVLRLRRLRLLGQVTDLHAAGEFGAGHEDGF
jgi:hypothetical protein